MEIDYLHIAAAKRASEICQESKEPYSNLTMIEALQRTAREFERKEKADYELLVHDSFGR